MFRKILVANRGEIACRIIKTARLMGIETLAVYSQEDQQARHVALADEACLLGPAEAQESYLCISKIIDIARQSGAGAIHPGYGFLSENADFAEACAAVGICFIGPSPQAIRSMGEKSEAKCLMATAGVPLVPGYHGKQQDENLLRTEAEKIGFPVMIKASGGGGGKGMRFVEKGDDFISALRSCKREALSNFGNDQVLVERFIENPRHIEMQIFADSHGQAVHLFERDCSLQRRHQKVIEEAPAPGLDDFLRQEMAAAALGAARAIGYEGAGTVEFIVACDPDGRPKTFYFMEMNTRLQVEHPVTEMITGLDLVEWQIRVANGERLPRTQSEISCRGHAIELRLYAEDPDQGFLPATGCISLFEMPREDRNLRLDSGVRAGDRISIHYDPMIAKLIAWGDTRQKALYRLQRALGEVRLGGVTCNRDFLIRILAHSAFAKGQLDTGFIARHMPELQIQAKTDFDRFFCLAALGQLCRPQQKNIVAQAIDPYSPWNCQTGWRLNGAAIRDLYFCHEETIVKVGCARRGSVFSFVIDDRRAVISCLSREGAIFSLEIDGIRQKVTLLASDSGTEVITQDQSCYIAIYNPLARVGGVRADAGQLHAPMPGRITLLHVKEGQRVSAGEALMVLEAMKMEHTIVAPGAGRVVGLPHRTGDQVPEGAELVKFETDEGN